MLRRYGFVMAVVAAAAGCSDALEQTSSAGQVIAVVNSDGRTVSFVSATDFSVRPVGLLTVTGVPTTLAGRGTTVIVPLGPADSVTVIRNTGLCTGLCVNPVVVIPLASGSGATGVAIQDDSIAWIANPNLNTVTRLNYVTPPYDTSSVAVGVHPQAIAIVRTRVFVLNGNLVSGTPAGPSWLTSFDCCTATTPDSIPLLGVNAVAAVVGDDSLLYVVEAGHPGLADGKLSIVDPVGRTELAVLNGLGESPGPAVFHPSGRLLIASPTEGILEVSTLTRSVTRGPGNGRKPGGNGVSGLALDLRGRIYAVDPGNCAAAGAVYVLGAPPDYDKLRTVAVGVCPSNAAVAMTP